MLLTADRIDIRIVQLYVRMKKDPNVAKFLDEWENLRSALLYGGLPILIVEQIKQIEDLDRMFEKDASRKALLQSSWKIDDLVMLAMNDLYRLGTIADFLTEMLRTGIRPKFQDEFVSHLRPLGLDWNKTTNEIRPTGAHPEAERLMESKLRQLLEKIDGSFPRMLRGAWEAYYSDNPDRYRQAVTSCRELLTDVIQKLGGSGTRRQRIEQILDSESRAQVVDATVSLVQALYGIQSAQQHDEPDQATALFALVETEHILHFLLTRYSSRQPKK